MHEKNDEIGLSDSMVEVEGCKGFVTIEQMRLPPTLSMGNTLSKSRGICCSERSWSRVLAIFEDNTTSIESDATEAPTFDATQKLDVGAFCWAKRERGEPSSTDENSG